MITPVNKHILVDVVSVDPYKKSKTGLIIPNQSTSDASGRSIDKPVLQVRSVADDVTLKLKKGDKLETWDMRILYFYDENDQKVALIKEDNVAAVVTSE